MIDKFLSVAMLVTVMVGVLGALGPSQVKADNDNKPEGKIRSFIGLWQGIDPSDGGRHLWSIAKKDGETKVRLSDTYIRACNGGRGTFESDEVVLVERDLVAPMLIQCLTPDNSPDGAPAVIDFKFTRIQEGIIEVTTLPRNPLLKPTTLFRINK